MEAPSSVPPRGPWSPVGYRVVEIADEQVPVTRNRLPDVRLPRASPPRRALPLVLFGIVAAAGLFIVALVIAVTVASLGSRAPVLHSPSDQLAHKSAKASRPQQPVENANAPARAAMQPAQAQPEALAPAGPVALVSLLQQVVPPAEAQDLAEGLGLPANNGCRAGRPADAERETFGTAVAFARNPRQAARLAAAEGKLTFLLHVSGNFEEARFT
jgi:cell division protein FtsN